jgi:TonB family protein
MNRLQKKCFVVSASLHGFLLVALVFGTAFLRSEKKMIDIGPVIDIVNAIPTDRMVNSGGNPNGNPNPPAPAPPPKVTPQPLPPQPKPEPEPPQPKPKPPEPKVVKKPDPVPDVPKIKAELPVQKPKKVEKKPLVKETPPVSKPISTKVVVRTNDPVRMAQALAQKAAREKAEREYARKVAQYNAERARVISQVGGIVGGVGKSLTHSTVVAPLGPGSLAFANYGAIVRDIYDRAWHIGQDLTDDDSTAVARVTIRKDGTVEEAKLYRRSGNSLLDKSVQRALDTVRKVAPFPEGATDSERTFNIEFNLKTRKAVG